MVGKRHQTGLGDDESETKFRDDIESGAGVRGRPRSPMQRFRDIATTGLAESRRTELKQKLKAGIKDFSIQDLRKSEDEIKAIKNKELRQFYEYQNARLDDWLEVDTLVLTMAEGIIDSMNPDADRDGIAERRGALQEVEESVEQLLPDDHREKRRKSARNARWAINVNVLANVLLLVAKIVAAFTTSSLSLVASLVDSVLDLLCTVIVWTTNRLVSWRLDGLRMRFPVGRRRLEPLGILVFSVIMIVSFAQILQESVTKLLPGGDHSVTNFPATAIGAMAATIAVKGAIWFACIPIKTTQVQALAQDCKTDVIFNTLSLLFPFIGQKASVWWLDPAGAAILSLFIIWDWGATCFENVIRLSGSTVDDPLQKKLMFMCYRFSPLVDGFKNMKAYHAGDGVWAEIDLLLDEKTPLNKAHDIAETLQYCCEALREVDRAFVTVDYTSQGPTGHAAEQA